MQSRDLQEEKLKAAQQGLEMWRWCWRKAVWSVLSGSSKSEGGLAWGCAVCIFTAPGLCLLEGCLALLCWVLVNNGNYFLWHLKCLCNCVVSFLQMWTFQIKILLGSFWTLKAEAKGAGVPSLLVFFPILYLSVGMFWPFLCMCCNNMK